MNLNINTDLTLQLEKYIFNLTSYRYVAKSVHVFRFYKVCDL